MENFENLNSKEKDPYQILKENLLNGVITPKEFKDTLIEKDQSTLDRVACIKNLELLQDPEIISFIQNSSEDIQKKYYSLLSFTELHVGQFEVFTHDNQNSCLEYFKKSLEHEYRAYSFPENIAYKNGTIAYLENNTQDLEKIVNEESLYGNNKLIIENMLKGLKERGYPDYKTDYHI